MVIDTLFMASRPCDSASAGHGPSPNNAFPQGANHVVGAGSSSTKYACPHPLAGWQAPLTGKALCGSSSRTSGKRDVIRHARSMFAVVKKEDDL